MNNFFCLGNAQSPQLTQGLLGSTGENVLADVIAGGVSKAAQLGQFAHAFNPAARNDFLAQRQNAAQQFAQQATAQQQQDAQNRGLLLSLATKFFGGGLFK